MRALVAPERLGRIFLGVIVDLLVMLVAEQHQVFEVVNGLWLQPKDRASTGALH